GTGSVERSSLGDEKVSIGSCSTLNSTDERPHSFACREELRPLRSAPIDRGEHGGDQHKSGPADGRKGTRERSMASWNELREYGEGKYNIADRADGMLKLLFGVEGDRSQIVLVARISNNNTGEEWVGISSP